jgi:hypothetical protein
LLGFAIEAIHKKDRVGKRGSNEYKEKKKVAVIVLPVKHGWVASYIQGQDHCMPWPSSRSSANGCKAFC